MNLNQTNTEVKKNPNPFKAILRWIFLFLYERSSKPNEIKALKSRLEFLERLLKVPIYCRSVDDWQLYFEARHSELSMLLDGLKEGTDEASYKQIDLFFWRYRYVFPPSRFEGGVFFDPVAILTKEEIAAAEKLEEFKQKPLPYIFPEKVEVNEPHLFWSELGLVHLPPAELSRIKDGDVIDGGAYCGDSALVFSKYHPSRIHCFEILPENLELLLETARLNAIDGQVEPVHMGLGVGSDKLKLVRRKGSTHSMEAMVQPLEKAIPDGWEEVVAVDVCSIDSYVEKNSLRPVLIKLDVEGSEYDVVSGALKTISKFKPLLLISVYHNPRDFFEIKPMVSQANPEYRFKFRYLCPTSPSNEFMMIAY